jgi:hypothetical protein
MAAKRKGTPNIMAEIFGEEPEPVSPPAVSPPSPPASDQPPVEPPALTAYSGRLKAYVNTSDKAKATYYLLPETVEDLEAAWIRLRQMVGQVEKLQKTQVSKSLIVEAALEIVLEELERKGTDSQLARKMTSFW